MEESFEGDKMSGAPASSHGDDAAACGCSTRAWCSDCSTFLPTAEFSDSALRYKKRTCKACVSRRNCDYRTTHWSVFVAAEARRAARRRGEPSPGITAAEVLDLFEQTPRCPLTREADPKRLRLARLKHHEPLSKENAILVAKGLREGKVAAFLAALAAARTRKDGRR